MAFTPEQDRAIKEAFTAKVTQPCPGCGNRNWSMSTGFIVLSVYPVPAKDPLGGPFPAYPSIAAVCLVCGNTQIYNVFVLGIADALGVKRAEAKEEKKNG